MEVLLLVGGDDLLLDIRGDLLVVRRLDDVVSSDLDECPADEHEVGRGAELREIPDGVDKNHIGSARLRFGPPRAGEVARLDV